MVMARPADWNGLADGQSWNIPAGPRWHARLDRNGRAHVIGEALAEHPQYTEGYAGGALSLWWTNFSMASGEARAHNRRAASTA